MKNLKSRELSFDDFRNLAVNPKLTRNQKIDFPESYRHGYTKAILADIVHKLQLTHKKRQIICDIGCGCGDLMLATSSWAKIHHNTLLLVDSKEMLSQVPNAPYIRKFAGKFPDIPALYKHYRQSCQAVLCYSVIQYVYGQGDIFRFIQKALDLIKVNGLLLLGDIPNEDKRNRFLKTPEGRTFVGAKRDRTGKMSDAVILKILMRFRRLGYETYLVPHPSGLPMANRREDIIIVKRI